MGFNTNLMISSTIVTIFFLVIAGMWFTLADHYDVELPDEYKETFANTQANYDVYSDQQQIMDGGDINTEGQDQAVYSNVIVATKQGQDAYRLTSTIASQQARTFGIDTRIVLGILTIVGLLSALSFISAITGNKN